MAPPRSMIVHLLNTSGLGGGGARGQPVAFCALFVSFGEADRYRKQDSGLDGTFVQIKQDNS